MEPAHAPDRLILKIVLSAAVAAAAFGLGLGTLRHEPKYFVVNELAATGLENHAETELRVRGFVVAGTIRTFTTDRETHEFLLGYHGVALRVQTHGPLPDTLRDQSEVVVQGRLGQRDGVWSIEGDRLITKCGGKYDGNPQALSAATFK